jgi:hypothetical protein
MYVFQYDKAVNTNALTGNIKIVSATNLWHIICILYGDGLHRGFRSNIVVSAAQIRVTHFILTTDFIHVKRQLPAHRPECALYLK